MASRLEAIGSGLEAIGGRLVKIKRPNLMTPTREWQMMSYLDGVESQNLYHTNNKKKQGVSTREEDHQD